MHYSDLEENVILEVLFSYNGLFSAEYSKSIQNGKVTLRTFHVLKIIRLSFLFVCLEGILGSGAALILKLCTKLGYSVVFQGKFADTKASHVLNRWCQQSLLIICHLFCICFMVIFLYMLC